jgi:hypothetical protein
VNPGPYAGLRNGEFPVNPQAEATPQCDPKPIPEGRIPPPDALERAPAFLEFGGSALAESGMRAAVMSGVEPGSTSETHNGVPSEGRQELHVAAECLVFLAEPQVVAVVADAREAVGIR